jgi:hypothetical protein
MLTSRLCRQFPLGGLTRRRVTAMRPPLDVRRLPASACVPLGLAAEGAGVQPTTMATNAWFAPVIVRFYLPSRQWHKITLARREATPGGA